jgi:hypothetical protein
MYKSIVLCFRGTKEIGEGWNVQLARESLEKFGRDKLGIKNLDDWYSIPSSAVMTIRRMFNGSLSKALKTLYPQHNWNPLKFSKRPRRFWCDERTQRDALESIGRLKFGVRELDDWYRVSVTDVISDLSFINSHYKGSLLRALRHLYPHHNWKPLQKRQLSVPRGHWMDQNTQRDALQRFGREHGVKELDDWYQVSATRASTALSFINSQYNGSLLRALRHLYPQHNWKPLKQQQRAPRGYWSDLTAQRDALERFGREHLGVQRLDDWHTVSVSDVIKNLSWINKYYTGSLLRTLQKLVPEHEWNPLRFRHLPIGYWQDPLTLQQCYRVFARWREQHNINSISDWFDELEPHQLQQFQRVAKKMFGSTKNMLQHWFPDTNWTPILQSSPQLELQVLLSIYSVHITNHITGSAQRHCEGIHSYQ